MKTLIIRVENASFEQLPADESVTNLRWLMQIGCYGTLQDIAQEEDSLWRDLLESDDCACVQIGSDGMDKKAEPAPHTSPVIGRTAGFWQTIDNALGSVLGRLGNETTVLVMLTGAGHTNFILVSPNSPLHGEIQGLQLTDLARTLLGLDKTNNVTEETGYTEEESAIVRERLTGLGYIG